jgi:hypothetical protein
VALASSGEALDLGSPRGEDNKRACTRTRTRWVPPRPITTAPHPSRTAVVTSPELLEHVLTFLAGGKEEAREDLGRAALVCRLWREAVEGEELWVRVASEMMPGMGRRMWEVGARRCVLERGHCLRDQKAWVGETWWGALWLQVEVWDLLDETCLLSAEGRMSISGHPHGLTLSGSDRCEVVGSAFSAASRDPVQRRFASIDDYFRRGPADQAIWVRVYVSDELRGRQALLWEAPEQLELRSFEALPDDPLRPRLPEGSRIVVQADYLPVYSRVLPGQAPCASVGFYVRPEAGQEGVAEADKLWRVAGGGEDNYGEHDSFFSLQFSGDVTTAQLASLTVGLLDL